MAPPVAVPPASAAGVNEPAAHDPYAALRLRDFRLYSAGWLFATVGYQMQSTALGWEIYQRTGSKMALGLLGGVQAIPLLLLALPAGQLADLVDRRRIAIVCALLTAVVSAGMAAVSMLVARGQLDVRTWEYLVYGLILVGASVSTFTRPAREALLPLIVPARIFNNAVTWNSTIFEVSSMSGPALAGIIIAIAHPKAVYIVSAVFSLCFMGFLLVLRNRPSERGKRGISAGNLVAGIRFVWSTKLIFGTITLDLFAVLLGGATYLLPVFAERLGVGPVGFGWLRASPAIGAFLMAILQAHCPPMKKAGRTLLLAVTGFGAATIVFGMSQWFWLSMGALFFIGALDNISVVVRHTLVQMLTPDPMRGRVAAVNSIFIGSSNELGGLESGVTAYCFGPVASVVGGGIGTILVVIAVAILWPEVRRFRSLADAKPGNCT